jgi:hypothetical protein
MSGSPRRPVLAALVGANLGLLGSGVAVAAHHGWGTGPPLAGVAAAGAAPIGRRVEAASGPPTRLPLGPRAAASVVDRPFPVGRPVTVVDARTGARVVVRPGVPSYSTTRLSRDYGYPPERGLYVSFPIRITEAGSAPIQLSVTDFVLDDGGLSGVTVDDGAAPYSGAPRQLDNTLVTPGQSITGTLTFDVPARHGTLQWLQGGQAVCVWTF